MKMNILNTIKFLNKHITLFFMCLLLWICKAGMAQNIDFSDLSNARCYTGYYSSPYLNEGIDSTRHYVLRANISEPNFDLGQGGGGVRIDSGYVRLGNTDVLGDAISPLDGYAEAIHYSFRVDNTNDLLCIRFYVILQNIDSHNQSQQAYFKIRILDSIGVAIPDLCVNPLYVYPSGLPNLAMHSVEENSSSGRFFTRGFAAFDLVNYTGQTITVEFITSDCALGEHYGYAYYKAWCERATMNVIQHEDVSEVSVPEGFSHYLWNNGDTLSTTEFPRTDTFFRCVFQPQLGCTMDWSYLKNKRIVCDNPPCLPDTCPDPPCSDPIYGDTTIIIRDTICLNDTAYVWHVSDTTIIVRTNSSQIHRDNEYLDTTYKLILSRYQIDFNIRDTVCLVEGEYHKYGFDYDSIYLDMPPDTLFGHSLVHDCDSNTILNLLVVPPLNPGYIAYTDTTICGNIEQTYVVMDSTDEPNRYVQYSWYMNGEEMHKYEKTLKYTHNDPISGIDTIMVVRTALCDPPDTLGPIYIHHHPAYSRTIFDTTYVGRSYTGNGFIGLPPFYTAGTYPISSPNRLTTIHGCDSNIYLTLVVIKPIEIDIHAIPLRICKGDGSILSVEGFFSDRESSSCPPRHVNIGDFICDDDSIFSPAELGDRTPWGVVFYVNSSGWHGSAVGLTAFNDTIWSRDGYGLRDIQDLEGYSTAIGALQDVNGYSNTTIIRQNGGAEVYPATYVLSEQEGWYFPAMGQLCQLLNNSYNVNRSLQFVGADILEDGVYWSSTEGPPVQGESSMAWKMDKNTGMITMSPKHYKHKIRSIHDF